MDHTEIQDLVTRNVLSGDIFGLQKFPNWEYHNLSKQFSLAKSEVVLHRNLENLEDENEISLRMAANTDLDLLDLYVMLPDAKFLTKTYENQCTKDM